MSCTVKSSLTICYSESVQMEYFTVCFPLPGKKYPFYGVQWHPEVNRFQWNPRSHYPHSKNAVRVASLLAEFFVNEGKVKIAGQNV